MFWYIAELGMLIRREDLRVFSIWEQRIVSRQDLIYAVVLRLQECLGSHAIDCSALHAIEQKNDIQNGLTADCCA